MFYVLKNFFENEMFAMLKEFDKLFGTLLVGKEQFVTTCKHFILVEPGGRVDTTAVLRTAILAKVQNPKYYLVKFIPRQIYCLPFHSTMFSRG